MSEEQGKYGDQPAAIIESPRNALALREDGLVDYKVWGWVKLSARFRPHIKKLKGAKLAVWICISLSIDENGDAKISVPEIHALTDYSESEIRECVKELAESGYISVNRSSGRTSVYKPQFAARGGITPTEQPLQKNDPSSLPVDYPSSLSKGISVPSYKELKELNGTNVPDMPIDWQLAHNQQITMNDQFEAKARDAANLVEMSCAGAGAIAEAFMLARRLLIPESKVKGNRKAAREMLEMGVKPEHVTQAVKDLTAKGMTVTDLFSVSKTAVDIANKAANSPKTETRYL
jgi:biotin operon repressor